MLTLACAISAEENEENRTVATTERSDAPDLMSALKCSFEPRPTHCAREFAGKMLDSWEDTLEDEMKSWGGIEITLLDIFNTLNRRTH